MAKKQQSSNKVQENEQKNVINLADVKAGKLVGQIRDVVVEFLHAGEMFRADVRIKTLSFKETEPLYTRLNNSEDVVAEWLAKCLVDAEGNLEFTKQEIEENFVQSLAGAIFDKVIGLEDLRRLVEGKGKPELLRESKS